MITVKKLFLIVVETLVIVFGSHAQEVKPRWLLGTGITFDNYMNTPGINLNVTYRLIGNFHLGPDFSVFLNRENSENGVAVIKKELEYNFNATQLFEINKWLAIYPLVGINTSKVTVHEVDINPVKKYITAFNTGGGFELELKTVKFFFESKYINQLDKYDLTLGVLYTL